MALVEAPPSSQTVLHVLQIVRNWGPVGGMESYVWHLSHALAECHCRVTILCEKAHETSVNGGIEAIEIGALRPKPRWILYWRFANKVEEVVQSIRRHGECIVHGYRYWAAIAPGFCRIRNAALTNFNKKNTIII
jgi:UDP-glucose:(heptosyl)LPS alpha-1,3-glucosyltransferase